METTKPALRINHHGIEIKYDALRPMKEKDKSSSPESRSAHVLATLLQREKDRKKRLNLIYE